MTIRQFLDDLQGTGNKQLAEAMKDATSIWSNDAAKGYAIVALQAAGYTREQISSVLAEMTKAFDELDITEAEKIRNT